MELRPQHQVGSIADVWSASTGPAWYTKLCNERELRAEITEAPENARFCVFAAVTLAPRDDPGMECVDAHELHASRSIMLRYVKQIFDGHGPDMCIPLTVSKPAPHQIVDYRVG